MTFGLLASCMLTPPVCVRRLQPQLLCFLIDDGDVVDLAAAGTTWDRGAQRGRLSERAATVSQHETPMGEWSGSSVRHRSRRMRSSSGGARTWRPPARVVNARESRVDCARAAAVGSARPGGRSWDAEASRDTARVRAASEYIHALMRLCSRPADPCRSLQISAVLRRSK